MKKPDIAFAERLMMALATEVARPVTAKRTAKTRLIVKTLVTEFGIRMPEVGEFA